MTDILAKIAAYKREEITRRKARNAPDLVEKAAGQRPAPRGFKRALSLGALDKGIALIAEIKKASPSAGVIRADFDPIALAEAYQAGGAHALSVLTDAPSFQGSDMHLVQARERCPLPALRKDFMLEPYQIAESRALGADCVLIILALVDDGTAAGLLAEAKRWGMDALLEVHTGEEMRRALDLGGSLIGINNRDLSTFETNLETFEALAPMASAGVFLVAESGVHARGDAVRLQDAGAQAILVGESLMRKPDPGAAARMLLGG